MPIALPTLLNQGSSRPRLVVLNSCQSGRTGTRDLFSSSAATLVRRGTSAVAAMQFVVSDESAITFARGFYESLSKGQTIDQATQSGRISILGGGSLEWVAPVLYVRGDTSRLFDVTPPVVGEATIVDDRPPVDDFVERDVADPSPASANEQKKGPKIWARPLVWLAGAIVAAIGIAITNTIVPRLTEVIDVLPERGDSDSCEMTYILIGVPKRHILSPFLMIFQSPTQCCLRSTVSTVSKHTLTG